MRTLTQWVRSLSMLAILMFAGGQHTARAATNAECGAQFSSDMQDNEQLVRSGKIDKEGFEQLANDAREGYRKCLQTGKYYGYMSAAPPKSHPTQPPPKPAGTEKQ